MSKKKLIFVITKSNWGGAQRYVFDMAHSASHTYDVAVILGGTGPLYDKLKSGGIRAIPLYNLGRDINVFSDLQTFFDLVKILKEEQPQILHLNSSKIGFLGALAGKLATKSRIIFTAHGWPFNENRSSFSRLFFTVVMYLTIALSDTTICVSKSIRAQVRRWPFIQTKFKVVHNGVSAPHYLPKDEARKMLVGLRDFSTEGVWIGTIAELHPIKGLEYAIKAMEQHQNYRYVIVGNGELREKLSSLIKKCGLEQTVMLAGHIDEAPRILKAFDVFLLPSLSEALNLSLLEAGLAGLPCIATSVGGIPEIIDTGKNGLLIQPKRSADITEAVSNLIASPEKREEYGKKLQEKVTREFSKEEMVVKTLDLYL